MTTPHFLVVGTARSGSTALHYSLRQHPQIFMPKQKEPCFYCFNEKDVKYKRGKFAFAVRDLKSYRKLFKGAGKNQVTGEISTPYLYLHEETISNIYKFHPDPKSLKIIILLRNPADRAYSQYLMKVREGREELSFDFALINEKERKFQNYSFDYFYADRGLYYKQVKDYLENFNSVKIIFYEDFKKNFEGTMKEILSFLNVDDQYEFKRQDEVNSSYIPRSKAIGKLVTTESKLKYRILNLLPSDFRLSIKEVFNRMNASSHGAPRMTDIARRNLEKFYYNDIKDLEKLIGKDLSHWLTLYNG